MTGTHGAGRRRDDRPGGGTQAGADDRESDVEEQLRHHFAREAAQVHASPELLRAARSAGAGHRSGVGPLLAPILAAVATVTVIAGWLVAVSHEPARQPATVPATATTGPTPSVSPPAPTRRSAAPTPVAPTPAAPTPAPPTLAAPTLVPVTPSPTGSWLPGTGRPTPTLPAAGTTAARTPVATPTSPVTASPTGVPATPSR